MELRLTFQDKALRLSIRLGKMVLKVTIPPLSPHLNPLIPYFLTLALLFSFIGILPLQKYAFLPVFFFFLTLFIALYYALDYRYLIGSGLLFLLACPFFSHCWPRAGGREPGQLYLRLFSFWPAFYRYQFPGREG